MLTELLNSGTFLHWMLAVGLTLLVLDIFINTELLAWVALVIFAAWGTWLLGLPIQWSVLAFIVFFALAVAIYYTLWVQVVRRAVQGLWLRKAPAETVDTFAGKTGRVIGGGENLCVRCGDHIFPIAESDRAGLAEGDSVRITALDGATARVQKSETSITARP